MRGQASSWINPISSMKPLGAANGQSKSSQSQSSDHQVFLNLIKKTLIHQRSQQESEQPTHITNKSKIKHYKTRTSKQLSKTS